MNILISLLSDVEDLYEDFLKPLGLTRSQYKKAGLKKGLSFKKGKELSLPCSVLRNGEINPIYEGPSISIIFENSDFLVVSKPAGIHGHSHSFSETSSVLNFLRSINKCADFGGAERGLLYRLDKETSGLLTLARKKSTYDILRENFSKLTKEKTYLAIVEGKVTESGDIYHLLKPFGEKGAKQVESEKGNSAHLKIEKVTYDPENNLSLLKISLVTGLRHQIRAQLSILGHPILGDSLYGGAESSRLFLHALRYSFEWNGETKCFEDRSALLFEKFFDLNSCL